MSKKQPSILPRSIIGSYGMFLVCLGFLAVIYAGYALITHGNSQAAQTSDPVTILIIGLFFIVSGAIKWSIFK